MKVSRILFLVVLALLTVSISSEAALFHLRHTAETPRSAKKYLAFIQETQKTTGSAIFLQQVVQRGLAYEICVTLEGDAKKFLALPKNIPGQTFLFDDKMGDTFTLEVLLTTSKSKIFDIKDYFPDRFTQEFPTLHDMRSFIERWQMYPIANGQKFPLRKWIESRKFSPNPKHYLQPHYLVSIKANSRGKSINLLANRSGMEEFHNDPEGAWRVVLPKAALKKPIND